LGSNFGLVGNSLKEDNLCNTVYDASFVLTQHRQAIEQMYVIYQQGWQTADLGRGYPSVGIWLSGADQLWALAIGKMIAMVCHYQTD